MNKKVKVVLAVLIFACFSNFVFSVNYGISLDSSYFMIDKNTVPSKDATKSLSETLGLWFNLPLNDSVSFIADGNYKLNYDFEKFSHQVDLSEFQLEMNFQQSSNAKINVNLGRFLISDYANLIYTTAIDGAKAKFVLSDIELGIFGGYTGLLNGNKMTIVKSSITTDSDSIYSLASPFSVIGVSAFVKNYLGSNSIGCDFSVLIPNSSEEERRNALYSEVYMNGAIGSLFWHDVTVGFCLYEDNENIKSGIMADGKISVYPNVLSSAITAQITFASDTFYPFTEAAVVLGESNSLTGLLKCGLNGSVKPVSKLLIMASGDYVMDVQGSTFNNDCIQWSSSLKWQILSDVQFSLFVAQKISLTENKDPLFLGSGSFVINL